MTDNIGTYIQITQQFIEIWYS